MNTMIVIVPNVEGALLKIDTLNSRFRIAPLKNTPSKIGCLFKSGSYLFFSNTTGTILNNFGKYRIRQAASCCFQCLIYTKLQNFEFRGQSREEEPCSLSSIASN